MTRKEYYNLREVISIHNKTIEYLNQINNIYIMYPELRNMTLSEVREWFKERDWYWEQEVQKALNVEE